MTEIFFATNRDVRYETSKNALNFGTRFHKGGPQMFRVGRVEVTQTGADVFDDKAWEVGRCTLYPEKLDSGMQGGAKLGSAALFDDLRRFLKSTKVDVIIYLHGFANDFPNAALRAATLQSQYGADGRDAIVIVFSWPSNGTVVGSYNYHSDRDDAALSGVAMARTLSRLVSFLADLRDEDRATLIEARRHGLMPDEDDLQQCNRSIHLVAHSMGNWALRSAINRFAEMSEGRVPRILDHAFLMAADEDADALAQPQKLGKLLRMANFINVYHARADRALQVSDTTKGNPSRLGAQGPENLDLLDERVLAIDCNDVCTTGLSDGNHQYYRLRKEVISDVVATLRGRSQQDRRNRVTVRPGRSWRLIDGQTAEA